MLTFFFFNYIQFRTEFKKVSKMPQEQTIISLIDDWQTWQKRIIAYARLEMINRPKLKTLIPSLRGTSEMFHGGKKIKRYIDDFILI